MVPIFWATLYISSSSSSSYFFFFYCCLEYVLMFYSNYLWFKLLLWTMLILSFLYFYRVVGLVVTGFIS